MLVKVDNCGATGLNSDLTPEELGAGVWSDVQNMRFRNGYAERVRGSTAAFTTPSITPYFITPYATSTTRYWVYAGLAAVYADDGTTRTDITGTAPTGAIDDKWTGGSLNGVLILNNGVDVPTYWGGDTANNLATLTGWDSNWRCKSLRPFKNFAIALNVTKSSTNYPYMVKWSDIAVPGAIPTSWDETDPATDAGEVDLDSNGPLIDCLPLGDALIVYAERSMHALTYVGAPYIFRVQKLPSEHGMLARGCGAVTPLGHVVLTAGDVVLATGGGAQSIANGAVRDYIFRNISSTFFKRAFVEANPQRSEVWVCFPFGESPTINRACVWNWESKTWGIRTLDSVTYGAAGQVDLPITANTWAGDANAWQADVTTWNEDEFSTAEARLVMCHSTPLISLQDTGTTDFGTQISAYLERTQMDLGDPTTIKTVRGIRPVIEGAAGEVISIQVGASMQPDTTPTYSTAVNYTIGTDFKIDTFATGRYISIKFSNSGFEPWRMKSFGVEYVNAGVY